MKHIRHLLLVVIIITSGNNYAQNNLTKEIYKVAREVRNDAETIGFTFSLPWINQFAFYDYYYKNGATQLSSVGVGAALFYKKGPDKISLNTGLNSSAPILLVAFDPGQGARTYASTFFTEAIYHRTLLNKFNAIGGLNYIKYKYDAFNLDSAQKIAVVDNTIGFTFGAEFLSKDKISLALFYRPAFFSFNKKQYRHLISLDLRFNFSIWKKRFV